MRATAGGVTAGGVNKKQLKRTAGEVKRVSEVLTTEARVYEHLAEKEHELRRQVTSYTDFMEASGDGLTFRDAAEDFGLR